MANNGIPSVLFDPSPVELTITMLLHKKCIEEIERRNDPAGVAKDLQIAEAGIAALLWRTEWNLELTIRIAEALGVIDETIIDEFDKHLQQDNTETHEPFAVDVLRRVQINEQTVLVSGAPVAKPTREGESIG